MRKFFWALVLTAAFGVGPAHALDAKGNARIDAAINRLNEIGDERPKEVRIPKLTSGTLLVIFVRGDIDTSGCPKGFINSPLVEDGNVPGFMCSGPSTGNFTYTVPPRAKDVNLEAGDFRFHWPHPTGAVVHPVVATINVPAFKNPVLLAIVVEGSQFNVCPVGFLMSPLANQEAGYLCSGPSTGNFVMTVPKGARHMQVEGGNFKFEWPSK